MIAVSQISFNLPENVDTSLPLPNINYIPSIGFYADYVYFIWSVPVLSQLFNILKNLPNLPLNVSLNNTELITAEDATLVS